MLKRTVLIVDDQQINRKILGRILSDDYQVIYACDGEEAVDILRQQGEDISAVLLDIVMPKMDGYEVLKIMGEDSSLSKIPVIVSSQMEGDAAELKALALGAQDFIAKPYKADIIRHRLGNMIKLRETAAMINKAEKDELTGLYNKQFFYEKVQEKLLQSPEESFDILCIGVERFKLINETYGDKKGDEVLCHIAQVMLEACRGMNICGRFAADEFYALIPYKENRDSDVIKNHFEKVNEFPIDMDIKLHCGLYQITDEQLPISTMCDRAKLAADVNRGKFDTPYSYYDDSLREKLLEEQFITSSMQTALTQHQFQVYYQPKYDLNTELIAGAEALVRWIHPEKGFLSPGAFIPLFEKNGFITQLDRYVWEKVCQDIRRWLDLGYPAVAISVNVSRADIYNPRLTEILLELIAKYNIPLHFLHLEITESAYTDTPEQIIAVVNRLRSLGFVIEMDDFGSGYSSLNMLADMPVDVLKLDMKFIQMESKKTSGKGILSFVISLAKWLDLAVVAEGVETSEQIASLRSMDCNYVQGFYYARPMKQSDFENLLQTSKTTQMVCTSRTAEQYVEHLHKENSSVDGHIMVIVDDIEVNRAVLASTFLDDYVIVEKENGKTAWDYLEAHYQDVEIIMLDLLMPVMDGFQLLEKIRSDERTRELPVIITSQGDTESEERALEMHADDFISKPYKPDLIKHRVHNVVSSYRLLHLQTKAKDTDDVSESTDLPGYLEPLIARYIEALKPHFDIVRLVEPKHTMVICDGSNQEDCSHHFCFSVWGKQARCNNCISLRALETQGRCSKLEYSDNGLYFVISEYVSYEESGAVIEMVTRLDDEYVDNVFEKDLLYMKLDEIHQQLEFDELTGIYNRRHIEKYLPAYVDNARKCGKDIGIAMIDVDSFKELNDSRGHLLGDVALKNVAGILEANIAKSKGDFVARFGGDEFMIVCRDIPLNVFENRITGVSHLITYMTVDDEKINIGISAGCVNISEFPEYTVEELVKKADERLYKAKHSGRGVVVAKDFD
ncbi:MAG: EAL domain-containing protein [Lachnospiraceae bacterium]|nr:EAL domain-containing protein [Lachnospiraceae bacterium]MDD3615805.1 EAL domain-containing protein [Lachnospiraceae bacterium]